MASTWRERHYREQWTKRVDTSLLYRIKQEAKRIRRRAEELEEKAILESLSIIDIAVAVASGEASKIDLSAHQFPESEREKASKEAQS
jgi:hypothetical protein